MYWNDLAKLARVWKHMALSLAKKIRILISIIISRLLYGLRSAWLNVADVRRLNGFFCRCLRVILCIKPAFYSRVSNASVLQQAGEVPLAKQLLKQQLVLFRQLARAPEADILRELTFVGATLQATTSERVRRVGRPRNEWAIQIHK